MKTHFFFVKLLVVALFIAASPQMAHSFCGFYVAGAGSSLFNKTSEVILVRDGEHTVVTMSNDYSGDISEFAMVVPVPVVLKESDIKVVDNSIFETIDAYSSPRLVEYHDENPCRRFDYLHYKSITNEMNTAFNNISDSEVEEGNDYSVTIEARYEVGEYEILILSAEESDGLKSWLNDNNYHIPAKAEDVLEPYIKSGMKFFVAKVNINKMPDPSRPSPIQIAYNHPKFMLPIRLGMANSSGEQDLVVYGFTKRGRIECTNYRTVKVPTANKIPEFIETRFGEFYTDVFDKAYEVNNENAVFLEYAWNVSPQAGMKCDPCIAPPPIFVDFQKAGVNWVSGMNSSSQVFFTRLHVRYGRKNFPQDLQFQITPNNENFQARYVINRPATGDMSCEAGQLYIKDLKVRQNLELQELAAITNWDSNRSKRYYDHLDQRKKERAEVVPTIGSSPPPSSPGSSIPFGFLAALGILLLLVMFYPMVQLTR